MGSVTSGGTLVTPIRIFLLLGWLSIIAPTLPAQVPRLISYQGVLADPSGGPLPDGIYKLRVALYDTAFGGTPFWSEEHQAVVTGGVFGIQMGSINPLAESITFTRQYYVEIAVGNELPFANRTPLTSVPYAFRAAVADSAIRVSSPSGAGDGGECCYSNTMPMGSRPGALLFSADPFCRTRILDCEIYVYTNSDVSETFTLIRGGNYQLGYISLREGEHIITAMIRIRTDVTVEELHVPAQKIYIVADATSLWVVPICTLREAGP
jgi:hypothetical protein